MAVASILIVTTTKVIPYTPMLLRGTSGQLPYNSSLHSNVSADIHVWLYC